MRQWGFLPFPAAFAVRSAEVLRWNGISWFDCFIPFTPDSWLFFGWHNLMPKKSRRILSLDFLLFCHTSFLLETSENFQTNWWLECKVFFFKKKMPSCHLIYYVYSYLVHVIQCSGGVCFQLNLYIMTYVFMTSEVPGANDELDQHPPQWIPQLFDNLLLETCKIHIFFGWFLLHQHALRIQDYAEISGPDGIGSLNTTLGEGLDFLGWGAPCEWWLFLIYNHINLILVYTVHTHMTCTVMW